MATAFVNPQQPRIDAWIQPGCRADIAVVSTESWPVDTVVTIGVADAAGVIAVPLLTITPDLTTLTATVALTGVQVAALAVACPPPYGVIDWQWRTGAGSPLGVGSLHWDLTGARTTQTVTVMMGPAGPGATPEAISALVEDYLVAHPPTGSGDVTGPASAIAGNLPVLDVTGKVLSDSGYDPTDFASAGHSHAGVYDAAGTAAGLVGAITPGSIGAAPALSPDDNYVTDAEKSALHTHPAVIAQGVTQADARAAIGAGTSSLVIGTGAGDAKAGNYAPDLSGYVPTSRTVAGKALTGNITLTASDVGALASETLPATIVDAKGDLIVGTAADTAARLPVGTDGQILTADAASAGGVKWAAGGGGGGGFTGWGGLFGPPAGGFARAPQLTSNQNGAFTLVEATLYVAPYTALMGITVTKLGVALWGNGGSGAVIRLGLYEAGEDGYPAGLIVDAGTVDGAAGQYSLKAVTLAAVQTIAPRTIFAAICLQGMASPAAQVISAMGDIFMIHAAGSSPSTPGFGGWAASGVTGALPATYPPGAAPSPAPPFVYLGA